METNYTYDKAGYLQRDKVETEENVWQITDHAYNGMEQRVSKTVDQVETKYIYSGSALLFTADENNGKITENILALNGQTIAWLLGRATNSTGFVTSQPKVLGNVR